MFLAQYNHLDKIQIDSIVDINIDQAKKNCMKSGLNEQIVKGDVNGKAHKADPESRASMIHAI